MIKEKLANLLSSAYDQASQAGVLGPLNGQPCPVSVLIEEPKLKEHGDFSCGLALKLASIVKASPIRIAETLAGYIDKLLEGESGGNEGGRYIERFEIKAPGFINFYLGTGWLNEALAVITAQGADYGRCQAGEGKRVLVEYVSANPTGELHIGHGRNAVFGSCLSNLLSFIGYKVEQEFYINDYGEQINQLGRCCFALYQRKNGRDVPYPAEGYPEEFLSTFVDQVIAEVKASYLELDEEEGSKQVGDLVKDVILAHQKNLLTQLGVHFDSWFSERTLHSNGAVENVLREFSQRGYAYEQDGAFWLKTKELGDERDRVLRKQGGATTYLANDAAYHLDKYARGYDLLINVWGADHHGQVPGLKGAVRALGLDADKLEVVLTQIVNLARDGQIVRMSKRMGTVVMLSEVMEEVGKDAVRYYLAESNPQNSINFDLDLAKKTSKENPAFYIQYAHARCCSILRRAQEESVNSETGAKIPAPITAEEIGNLPKIFSKNPQLFQELYDKDFRILDFQKQLVRRLEAFPWEVDEAGKAMLPGRLARYAYELANDLQKFYEVSRVIVDDPAVSRARLALIFATRQVLANALGIIGVSAPERM
jgi:arginyl-tRNA synthetase